MINLCCELLYKSLEVAIILFEVSKCFFLFHCLQKIIAVLKINNSNILNKFVSAGAINYIIGAASTISIPCL
jgi:hypothetical protein